MSSNIISDDVKIWIFNVGRGLSIFIKTPQDYGILYDMGSSEDFSPTDFLKEYILSELTEYSHDNSPSQPIAQTILSHPHADHIFEVNQIKSDKEWFSPTLLTCPHDQYDPDLPDERVDFDRINNPEYRENLVEIYRSLYQDTPRSLPLQTVKSSGDYDFPEFEYGIYYIRPPIIDEQIHESVDQDYSNATSIILYLRYHNQSILIPSDMTPTGFDFISKNKIEKRFTNFARNHHLAQPNWHKETTNQPDLPGLLKEDLTILVAPHHGLESGFSETLFEMIHDKPELVAISEKRKSEDDNEGEIDNRYRNKEYVNGMTIDIEGETKERRSVSTTNNQHILINFTANDDVEVFLRNDPSELLEL